MRTARTNCRGRIAAHATDLSAEVILDTQRLVEDRLRKCASASGLPVPLTQLMPGKMLRTRWAARLAEFGVGVYEIQPGIIATDMTSTVKDKYDKLIAEGITPIKRWGQPEDIAKAVAACVRGDLKFSTGEVINVDGGFHLRHF